MKILYVFKVMRRFINFENTHWVAKNYNFCDVIILKLFDQMILNLHIFKESRLGLPTHQLSDNLVEVGELAG